MVRNYPAFSPNFLSPVSSARHEYKSEMVRQVVITAHNFSSKRRTQTRCSHRLQTNPV